MVKFGLLVKNGSRLAHWLRRNRLRIVGRIHVKKLRRSLVMYDDVNPKLMPHGADAYAGYVGGKWPTFNGLATMFPEAKHLLSIAIAADEDADALDIERYDATIDQAPGWYQRQKTNGAKQPVFYISLSEAQPLVNYLAAHGIPRRRFKIGPRNYRLVTAHYTYKPHRCSPLCGFGLRVKADATQWTDRAHGISLDETLCRPGFFN